MKLSNYSVWLFRGAWVLLGAGCLVLLAASIRRQNETKCTGLRIQVEGPGPSLLDSAEVRSLLTDQHRLAGTPIGEISTQRLEAVLEKNPWVQRAELFFDSHQVLWIKVFERKPVARLFSVEGTSCYLDTSCALLPLKDGFPELLPVFTSCPPDKKNLSATDTLLLKQVVVLSAFLSTHPLWMNMIQQIDVDPGYGFDLVPTLGDFTIHLGDTANLEAKFQRLQVFCAQVLPRVGWKKYASIDLRFAGQVVGVQRDVLAPNGDTAKARVLLEELIEQGRALPGDTVLRQTSPVREPAPNIDSTRDILTP